MNDGNTILHQASSLINCETYFIKNILEYFIENTNILVANNEAKTPLDIFLENDKTLNCFDLKDKWLSKLRKEILIALNNNDINKIKLAINEKNKIAMDFKFDDQSLLWYACENLNEDIAIYLLSLGNKVNKKNGDTLLIFACEQGLTRFSLELIKYGANIYKKNTNGKIKLPVLG